MAHIFHSGRNETPALAASSAFGKYRPETEQGIRTPSEVKTDKVIENMKKIWKRCAKEEGLNVAGMGAWIHRLRYTPTDIEAFSIAIAEYQYQKDFSDHMGFFLSSLINNCKGNEVTIHTAHLTERIDNLGFRNTKDITVKGNSGRKVGYGMKGGTITVEGNAGGDVGLLIDAGSIIVKGDSGVWVGRKMEGGVIIIEGNTGEDVGYHMQGGEIHILGDSYKISNGVWAGKIFHGNDLVLDKIWDEKDNHEDPFDDYNG